MRCRLGFEESLFIGPLQQFFVVLLLVERTFLPIAWERCCHISWVEFSAMAACFQSFIGLLRQLIGWEAGQWLFEGKANLAFLKPFPPRNSVLLQPIWLCLLQLSARFFRW